MKRLAAVLATGAIALGAMGALMGAPTEARAQDIPVADSAAEARAQYSQGTTAFQAKRFPEAALHFEAAAAFRVNAIALYTAGLAWDGAGRPERAADAYARALEVPGLDATQTKKARDRVEKLEGTLGVLAVTAPDGWKVQLDALTEAPTPARLHGQMGSHSLSVKPPGKPIESRSVTLSAGQVTKLVLEEKAEPPPKPTTDPTPTKPTTDPTPPPAAKVERSYWITRRVIGVGVAGLGVAALGATAIFGIEANSAKDAYNAGPTREAFDHASSLQTFTNVALVAGGVLLVGGIVLVVVPDVNDGRVEVGIGPNGARIGGTF